MSSDNNDRAGGYDVIGDVHGYADRLKGLLGQLGYAAGEPNGQWAHPDGRQAIFVGDMIDRGEQQLGVLRIARAMVEAGAAQVVLGNHEFNAVAYATVDPVGVDYCRPHSAKNTGQHETFLAEVGFDTPLHREIVEWFRTFPLWLDLEGGLRVVHACWSQADMDRLASHLGPGDTLTTDLVIAGSTKGNPIYDAIENVLKGPEVDMAGHHYLDKDCIPRYRARARWWDRRARTLREVAEIPNGTDLVDADGRRVDALPDIELPDGSVPRHEGTTPVLYGHYWRSGNRVVDEDRLTACVDYSAGKGGPLVAYRWNQGEVELDERNLTAF